MKQDSIASNISLYRRCFGYTLTVLTPNLTKYENKITYQFALRHSY